MKFSLRKINLPAYLILLVLLYSCGTSNYFSNRDYGIKNNESKKMCVYPLPINDITISTLFKSLFSVDSNSTYSKNAIISKIHKIQNATTREINKKVYVDNSSLDYNIINQFKLVGNYFEYQNIQIDELPEIIKIPKREFLEHIGVSPDIIVLFTGFHVRNSFVEGTSGYFNVDSQGNSKSRASTYSHENLITDSEYIIWDYNKNMLVKIGRIETKTSSSDKEISINDFSKHVKEMIFEVLYDTPMNEYKYL